MVVVVCALSRAWMHQEVLKVPFRAVYEFGGGLHCATWDIWREDDDTDLFPQRGEGEEDSVRVLDDRGVGAAPSPGGEEDTA